MLTLEQALRRSAAITLGLAAFAGTAAAQGAPDPKSDPDRPTTDTTGMPDTKEPSSTDMSGTTQPPAPAPTTVIIDDRDKVAPQPTYTTNEDYSSDTSISREGSTLERYGVAVSLGGGVEGFTNDTARRATNDGGSWDVRVAVGTRSPIGFEGSYIGSAQSIDALGLDNNTLLVGNGLDAKVRVNLLDSNIQPFAFGGIGWRHYSLARDNFNTSAVKSSDDVVEFPVGAGVAWKYRGFVADARGEFRFATQEDLMPALTAGSANGTRADMHRWGLNANLGYAF